MLPYFSIIIPMYNRERFITRAINSCLKQDFENYEIIVVDDGSTDESVDVVKSYTDIRIKLIGYTVNRGVGHARNTGVDAATGEWVICFDSDDELLDGALSIIYRRSRTVDENIARMQFMVQMDTGEFSPDPPLKNEFWDYIKYIKWKEACYGRRSESFQVVRRITFEKVRFYNTRSIAGPYHFDFMKKFNARTFPDVVRIYHRDADNQITKPGVSRIMEGAQNHALSGELLLKEHGAVLKKYAPRIYARSVSGLATSYFISGKRLQGIKYSFCSLASNLLSLRYWIILLVGLLGAKPLARLKTFRSRLF